jgi:hypothetical protein
MTSALLGAEYRYRFPRTKAPVAVVVRNFGGGMVRIEGPVPDAGWVRSAWIRQADLVRIPPGGTIPPEAEVTP